MVEALSGELGSVAAAVLGLPAWQLVVLLIGAGLLLTGVPILVLVWRIDKKVTEILKDQEVRVDAFGRKRPDRLKED